MFESHPMCKATIQELVIIRPEGVAVPVQAFALEWQSEPKVVRRRLSDDFRTGVEREFTIQHGTKKHARPGRLIGRSTAVQ